VEERKKAIIEYVWLDGYNTPNLRSKTKVIDWNKDEITLDDIPEWNFDGSSTRQALGHNSECLLKPVRLYGDWTIAIVLCEVMNSDGTPHQTNQRALLRQLMESNESIRNSKWWFGFEQEYFITKGLKPLGFPSGGYPKPQGLYYCGVGGNQVVGRGLVMAHLHACLQYGMDITGVNAEVAVGQWEYQCFNKDALKACDDLWVSRYLLYKKAEDFDWDIDITPKPVAGDWNGSGCHTNFSTKEMREIGGEGRMANIMKAFKDSHLAHIAGYGEGNDRRLTGDHETQRIDTFSCGVGDRGASIRIPTSVPKADPPWSGYVEDRRPASNCDPYIVSKLIIKTYEIAE